jgi:hypothetical protein
MLIQPIFAEADILMKRKNQRPFFAALPENCFFAGQNRHRRILKPAFHTNSEIQIKNYNQP